jgi:hypothetical protein
MFKTVDDLVTSVEKQFAKVFEDVSLNEDGVLEIKKKSDIHTFSFNQHIANILGFKETKFINQILIKGVNEPKVMNTFTQMFIYTNIINPIHVGGVLVPLLKSIWIENKYKIGEPINEVIDQPMYIPLSCTTINNIEINIRSDSGKLLKFSKGSKSSLTLHFQKYDERGYNKNV